MNKPTPKTKHGIALREYLAHKCSPNFLVIARIKMQQPRGGK